jgi:hypothetical protein
MYDKNDPFFRKINYLPKLTMYLLECLIWDSSNEPSSVDDGASVNPITLINY